MKITISMLSLLVITLPGLANLVSSGNTGSYLPRVLKSGTITYIDIGIHQPNVEDCYQSSAPGTCIDNNWINIFPNPSPGQFTLEIKLTQPGTPLVINIHDITGKRVFESREAPDGDLLRKDLNVGHLHKGVYLIRITGKDKSGVKTIIIN
jgi:hypothetical protein